MGPEIGRLVPVAPVKVFADPEHSARSRGQRLNCRSVSTAPGNQLLGNHLMGHQNAFEQSPPAVSNLKDIDFLLGVLCDPLEQNLAAARKLLVPSEELTRCPRIFLDPRPQLLGRHRVGEVPVFQTAERAGMRTA